MKKILALLTFFVLTGCGIVEVRYPKDGEIIDKIYTPAKTETVTVYEHDIFTGNVLPKTYENILEHERFEFEIIFKSNKGNDENITLMVSRYSFSTYEIGDSYQFIPPKSSSR